MRKETKAPKTASRWEVYFSIGLEHVEVLADMYETDEREAEFFLNGQSQLMVPICNVAYVKRVLSQ